MRDLKASSSLPSHRPMSTDLLSQIDRLEEACHAALRNGDDADTIAVLVQTLNAVNFGVSAKDRTFVRGLANLASAHADMLRDAIDSNASAAVVHRGLVRLCNTLSEFRDSLEAQAEADVFHGNE